MPVGQPAGVFAIGRLVHHVGREDIRPPSWRCCRGSPERNAAGADRRRATDGDWVREYSVPVVDVGTLPSMV